MSRTPSGTTTRIVQLFPDLLGTYGDGGNVTVLTERFRRRGLAVARTDVTIGDPIPDDAHLYVIGGGEDGPQSRAADLLRASGSLHKAVAGGAAVLAVCAGFQMLGKHFVAPDGTVVDGLGLLDVATRRGPGERIVGEVVATPVPALALPTLTGYENHGGVTDLGGDASPLGTVTVGTGNRPGAGVEGAWQGRIVATYLHGPVLARNPALADLFIAWATDVEPGTLAILDDGPIDALRAARLRAATAT